jgi:hypothetical protein
METVAAPDLAAGGEMTAGDPAGAAPMIGV